MQKMPPMPWSCKSRMLMTCTMKPHPYIKLCTVTDPLHWSQHEPCSLFWACSRHVKLGKPLGKKGNNNNNNNSSHLVWALVIFWNHSLITTLTLWLYANVDTHTSSEFSQKHNYAIRECKEGTTKCNAIRSHIHVILPGTINLIYQCSRALLPL